LSPKTPEPNLVAGKKWLLALGRWFEIRKAGRQEYGSGRTDDKKGYWVSFVIFDFPS